MFSSYIASRIYFWKINPISHQIRANCEKNGSVIEWFFFSILGWLGHKPNYPLRLVSVTIFKLAWSLRDVWLGIKKRKFQTSILLNEKSYLEYDNKSWYVGLRVPDDL